MNLTSLTGIVSTVLFFTFSASTTNAQKLPNKQETGLYAPANVKIDGKTTEWGNTFQAFNHATEVYYTLTNDNTNLYLAIHVAEPLVMRKIVAGGITFTINASEKNKKNEDISITYPAYGKKNQPDINLRNKPNDASKLDSFKNAINAALIQKAKEIRQTGIPAVSDTLISIYNEYNIKAAAVFNDQIAYTYELALPLKYMKPLIDAQSHFNYTIRLNGSTRAEGTTIEIIEGGTRVTSNSRSMASVADMQLISSPTYFNGEYTLAKK